VNEFEIVDIFGIIINFVFIILIIRINIRNKYTINNKLIELFEENILNLIMEIGNWGLGIGYCPNHNPQSPIPNFT